MFKGGDDDDDDDMVLLFAADDSARTSSPPSRRRLHKGPRPISHARDGAEARFRAVCSTMRVQAHTVFRLASTDVHTNSGYKAVLRPMLQRCLLQEPQRDTYCEKLHFVDLNVEHVRDAAEVTSASDSVVCLCGRAPTAQTPGSAPVIFGVRDTKTRLLLILGACCASRAGGYTPALQPGDVTMCHGSLVNTF